MGGYYNWPTTMEFDEERDFNEYHKCWTLFGTFCIPAPRPLCLWGCAAWNEIGMSAVCARLSVPTNEAWTSVTKDGYWYFSVVEIPREDWQQREPAFRERMTPFIEDFEREWRGRLVPELLACYDPVKKADVENMSNVELVDLWDHFAKVVVWKQWEVHMGAMFPVYWLYGLFEDMCRELIGIDGTHPQFKALMGGFESAMQDLERGLWQLGDRAKELGLEPVFQATPDDEQLLSKLEESESGRKWVQELNDFLQVYGWRTRHFIRFDVPSWVEKPSEALPDIRRAMARGGTFILDEERQRLVEEREQAEKDVLSHVPSEKREMFEKLMRGAQWCGRWSEDHVPYCEWTMNALGRKVTKEIAKRFVQAGVIDEPDDIYFLLPDEIRRPLLVMPRCRMQKTAGIRKQQWQEFLKQEPPPFIGDPSVLGPQAAVNAPLRILAPHPMVKPELKADLYGTGSSAGVVEGTARVIMSEAEFSQLQPGEILVAPFTHSAWTSLFWLAKGAVTDHGGSLAHAVIIGREYGIPVVAATIEATQKIKTGMRVRVDGDNCCVYILE